MSGKRGRKCSVKFCQSYQHTHKHLSFFRFPKDPKRCKEWIECSKRPELLDKINVHEERVCERHFDDSMFVNDYHNRLHQSAVPMLYLADDASFIPSLAFPTKSDHKAMNKMINARAKADLSYEDVLRAQLNKNTNQSDALALLLPNASPINPINLSKTASPTASSTPTTSLKSIDSNAAVTNPNYKRPRQIFTLSQEEQLAVHVRDTATYYSGLSSKEVRILAFVFGVCNQVDMPVGWRETHQASFDWCLGFIKRNKLAPMILTSHTYKNVNNSKAQSIASPAVQVTSPNVSIENGNGTYMSGAANGNSTASISTTTPIEIDE